MQVRKERKIKSHLVALISAITGFIIIVIYLKVKILSENIALAFILFPAAVLFFAMSIHIELAYRYKKYRQEMVVLPTLIAFSPFLIIGIIALLFAKEDRQIGYAVIMILTTIVLLITIIKIQKDVKNEEHVSKRGS